MNLSPNNTLNESKKSQKEESFGVNDSRKLQQVDSWGINASKVVADHNDSN